MGRYFFIFISIIFLVFSNPNSFAQTFNPKCRYTSIGGGIKGSYFDGDIPPAFQFVRPGVGATINRRISPHITLFSELMWIRVMADDYSSSNLTNPAKMPYYIRNLHFRNDIKQFTAGFKYDLFPSLDHYRKRPIYNLYGSVGVAVFYHNPRAAISRDTFSTRRKWVELQPLETENQKYSRIQMAIPVAVGIRYKISLHWDMEVEVAYNYTLTDFLDDVSGNYADPNSLNSDQSRQLAFRSGDKINWVTKDKRELDVIENELGYPIINGPGYSYVQGNGPGDARGTKKGNDAVVIFNIRFLYAIPGAVNCPKFREFQ